ncbi:uncharacterized protein LOC133879425 [Alnus glutinosa]|uniref:uncharacterized protein LOC133859828 n=1 Tax=Alnus glutinosa TaxID=3517 RepID=UPI002D79BC2F|nr:uncharacterized protein LOC133859828 [Alnus glutinosa]XP_062173984.1 uncharacterized protein LOC133879425 [Alnus glutinosa]
MKPIFCGNFEYDARPSDLERLFSRYGKVERVDMKSVRHFLKNQTKNFQRRNAVSVSEGHEDCEHLEVAVKKLSLASTTASLDHDQLDPFATLSSVCGQSSPSTLKNAFSKYWFVSYPHSNLLMCS